MRGPHPFARGVQGIPRSDGVGAPVGVCPPLALWGPPRHRYPTSLSAGTLPGFRPVPARAEPLLRASDHLWAPGSRTVSVSGVLVPGWRSRLRYRVTPRLVAWLVAVIALWADARGPRANLGVAGSGHHPPPARGWVGSRGGAYFGGRLLPRPAGCAGRVGRMWASSSRGEAAVANTAAAVYGSWTDLARVGTPRVAWSKGARGYGRPSGVTPATGGPFRVRSLTADDVWVLDRRMACTYIWAS